MAPGRIPVNVQAIRSRYSGAEGVPELCDEVELLRAENERLKAQNQARAELAINLQDENERLLGGINEALIQIGSLHNRPDCWDEGKTEKLRDTLETLIPEGHVFDIHRREVE